MLSCSLLKSFILYFVSAYLVPDIGNKDPVFSECFCWNVVRFCGPVTIKKFHGCESFNFVLSAVTSLRYLVC